VLSTQGVACSRGPTAAEAPAGARGLSRRQCLPALAAARACGRRVRGRGRLLPDGRSRPLTQMSDTFARAHRHRRRTPRGAQPGQEVRLALAPRADVAHADAHVRALVGQLPRVRLLGRAAELHVDGRELESALRAALRASNSTLQAVPCGGSDRAGPEPPVASALGSECGSAGNAHLRSRGGWGDNFSSVRHLRPRPPPDLHHGQRGEGHRIQPRRNVPGPTARGPRGERVWRQQARVSRVSKTPQRGRSSASSNDDRASAPQSMHLRFRTLQRLRRVKSNRGFCCRGPAARPGWSQPPPNRDAARVRLLGTRVPAWAPRPLRRRAKRTRR
jgi:hypothetical protein